MKIEMINGCINDWLGVDGIREVDMTEKQKIYYFKEIMKRLPEIDVTWFNRFLQWICEEYGEMECSDKPCECCGDYTVTYTLEF